MPVPPVSNNFEGGVDGNNILTSDTGSGDAWSAVDTGGGTLTYDDVHAASGTLAAKLISTSNAPTFLEWTGMGTLTGNVYMRTYFYITAFHATAFHYHSFFTRTSGAGCSFLAFENAAASPAGRIHAEDNIGNVIAGSVGTVSPALNQWVRVEYRVDPGTAGTGEVEWRLYNDANSDTISDSKLVSGVSIAADIGRFRQGIVSTTAPTSYTVWMDDIAVSTTGWLGPSVTASTAGYLRAYGPAAFATAAADLYTVPAGFRYTIRNLHVNNPSGGEIEFTLSVGADAAGTRLLDQKAVAAGDHYVSRRAANHTIEAGEKIQGFADSTAAVLVIDGYLYNA